MGWVYSQRTGEIRHNGVMIGRGYSGKGVGKNNPHMQNVGFKGPIPRGAYFIGHAYHHFIRTFNNGFNVYRA